MAEEQFKSPALVKPIQPIVINEGASFRTLDLKEFIQSPDEDSGDVRFVAGLDDGNSLPQGFICTSDGLLCGIPAAGTAGDYNMVIIAENESDTPYIAEVPLTIKSKLGADDPMFLTNLKSEVWKALGQNLPLPEMAELSGVFDRPISPIEVYYLFQRFAVLTIWDIYNLEAPSDKVLLNLEGANPHYHYYDRGSCLVAAPKDLFSHERTLADTLQAARALAREVYKRGWTIEFAGFNKMIRAAWVELQILGDKHGKPLEIVHYSPSSEDLKLYVAQSENKGPSIA